MTLTTVPEGLTDLQRDELARIRELLPTVGEREIAEPEVTDLGVLWVWFSHGRFCVYVDGTHMLTRYGDQLLFGLKVGELRPPVTQDA